MIFSGQQQEPTQNFVIALLFLATAIAQLWINQPKTFLRNSRVFLVFGIIFLQLGGHEAALVLCNSGVFVFSNPETAWLIAPYAFAPLVLCVLLGRNHGLYAAVFVSLWSSILFGKNRCAAARHRSDQRLYRGSISPSRCAAAAG